MHGLIMLQQWEVHRAQCKPGVCGMAGGWGQTELQGGRDGYARYRTLPAAAAWAGCGIVLAAPLLQAGLAHAVVRILMCWLAALPFATP